MSQAEATLEQILALLPSLDDLEVLRLRLVASAVRDPGKEWDGSSAITTIDKRLVDAETATHALEDARASLHAFVDELHDGLRPFFASFFGGDHDQAARDLVALGEKLEERGRAVGARDCYRAALTVSLPLLDKGAQILALRRIARVSGNLGDFQEALSYYERSAELARDSGNLHAEVIARTGLGNMRMWQGRWSDAERHYQDALALAESAGPGDLLLERGHLYNNLGNLTTRTRRLEESERWFESAFRTWDAVYSPVDLAVCHAHHAHLREAEERWDEARRSYEAALALPTSASTRSVIATDFAEWWLHEGHVTQAEEWGRKAEELAIASGSPYTIARMYHGRGNIARSRGDEDGFTQFEKALEIAREKEYPYLEAEVLVDYASLRADNGGTEEAVAYLERACELFRDLGALGDLERAERALTELRTSSPAEIPIAELAGEAPLAGAAD
ncbi:MAG TPA: tetratricopeptide repeat protein [Longimicrobium sp.]|nr:tetratricopeptide repeat protein [Longimicrobium sp.]